MKKVWKKPYNMTTSARKWDANKAAMSNSPGFQTEFLHSVLTELVHKCWIFILSEWQWKGQFQLLCPADWIRTEVAKQGDYLVNLVQRTAGYTGNFLFDSQLGFRALAAEFESKAKRWKNC